MLRLLFVVAESDLAYAIGVLRNGKVRYLVYTYLLLYTYTCNNSTGFAFASAMNLSDYISHNSLYFYNTIYNHIEKKRPS